MGNSLQKSSNLRTPETDRGSETLTLSRVNAESPRAATIVPDSLLQLGSRGIQVEKLQNRLRALGYDIKIDGAFGENTANAVKHFQTRSGLTPDGLVGEKTLAALNANQIEPQSKTSSSTNKATPYVPSPEKTGTPGLEAITYTVEQLQNRLRDLGYNIASDGKVGNETLAAVKHFQQQNGLKADGIVGPRTIVALNAAKFDGSTEPVQTPQITPKLTPSYEIKLAPLNTPLDGYDKGKKFNFYGVQVTITVGEHEKARQSTFITGIETAEAFHKMAMAANTEAGISLTVNNGFRTILEQTKLFRARQNYELAKEAGLNPPHVAPAAKPGHSNHQNGTALDINTGSYNSKAYHWLAKNAERFGFKDTVRGEHWHWEYHR